MKWIIIGIGVMIAIFIVSFVFGTCNLASKMVNDGLQTTYQEFKPSELLRKYEWFKDASSQLDAKLANLGAYEGRFQSIRFSYGSDSSHRAKWSRDDREQWDIWQSEMSGVKASYNDLAAEYNSQMSKFNYRFCNVGGLPQGATVILPREYKPYIYQ